MSKKRILSLVMVLALLLTPFSVFAATSSVPATAVRDIPTGYYFIYCGVGNNKVVSTIGEKVNGSSVRSQIMSRADWQIYYVKSLSDGTYTFKQVYSSRYLALKNNKTANNTQVTIQTAKTTETASWYLKKSTKSGCYNIMSVKARKALTVQGGSGTNATPIKILKADNSASQNFRFVSISTTQTEEMPLVDNVKTGYYRLQSQANKSRYLEVAENSFKPQGNIQLGVTSAQQEAASIFYIQNLGQGYYTVTSALGGFAMEVASGSPKNGTNVRQNDAQGTTAQKWLIRKTEASGYYTLAPANGKTLMLDTKSSKTALGTNVIVSTPVGSATQGWKLVKVSEPSVVIPNGVYTIGTQNDRTALVSVKGGSNKENANIQLAKASDSNAQKFTIIRTSGNYYKVINANSGRLLTAAQEKGASGTNLVQGAYSSEGNQLFKITGCRGRYHFVSAASGLAMVHYAGKTAPGTNVWLVADKPTLPRQLFRLTETTVTLDSTRGYTYVTDQATNTRFKVEKQYLTDPKVGTDVTEADFFAAVLYTEAGDQGIAGMMMVGYVIMTRMQQGIDAVQGADYVPYPGTLNLMIYHYDQWQVARDGALTRVLKDIVAGEADYLEKARTAAKKVLAGEAITLEETAVRYSRQTAKTSSKATLAAGSKIKKAAFIYNSFMTPKAWSRYATDGVHSKFAAGYGAGKNTLLYKGHVFFLDEEAWN